MLQLESFIFNPFSENTYVVYDENSKECVIIDPGCGNSAEENQLFGFIDSHRLKPLLIINTHGHLDHILGNGTVKQRYGIPVAAHPDVAADFDRSKQQSVFFGMPFRSECGLPDRNLKDGEIIKIGESTLEVICTPGHAEGSISLYAEMEGWVFTGDALSAVALGAPISQAAAMQRSARASRRAFSVCLTIPPSFPVTAKAPRFSMRKGTTCSFDEKAA